MEIICYGQINQGQWCQEHYESASRDARKRAKVLREAGYEVIVSSLGSQVTSVGTVKMTIITITPGKHEDTFDLPKINVVKLY